MCIRDRQSTWERKTHQRMNQTQQRGSRAVSEMKSRELLVMTIELQDGRTDTLTVYEGDDPHEVAYAFCLRHNLGIQVVEALKTNIIGNMRSVLSENATPVPPEESEILQERCQNSTSEKRERNVFDRLQMNADRHVLKSRKAGNKGSPKTESKLTLKSEASSRRVTGTSEALLFPGKSKFATIERGADGAENISDGGRFEALFEDWKVQAERKKQLTAEVMRSECPFQPTLQTRKGTLPSFMERREKELEERAEKARKMQEEQQLLGEYDVVTGQKLFNPVIIRRSPKGRNEGRLPIGDYLYKKSEEYSRRKRELVERDTRSRFEARARSNERSAAMVEDLRRRRLMDIFAMLDSDGDGQISASKVDITGLPTDILELFAPLLCELEEVGEFLNVEDFIASSERLMKTLSQAERDRIILGPRRSPRKEDYSFKPEINERSAKIAEPLRPYGKKELYDVYIEERKNFEERMRELQEQKEEQQLRECCFHPILVTRSSLHTLQKANALTLQSSAKQSLSNSQIINPL
eukprot:TRINITY_DN2168_c0_g1_i1.p1 TRINITY_DN2168_c0_g1~~TRINITY_DN2168_c0_g1_i1.p1  ORF type:complete len:546 (-),score=153.67 TRINITY_DN2168_c0_g1_i1:128-1705(-)